MEKGRVTAFVKSEPVLTVSAILAVASMFVVHPSADYLGYINVEVLCIIFCFLTCVTGLSSCGVFESIAARFIGDTRSGRRICMFLVLITFVGSMFITNDMALITFVPLAVAVLTMAGMKEMLAPVIVMQTVGANLGCMLTPFGSPHNILLVSVYDVSMAEFLEVMLPLAIAGTILMLATTLTLGKGEVKPMAMDGHRVDDKRFSAVMCVMFVLSIGAVLRFIPYQLTLVAVLASVLLMKPKVLRKVDYGLLLTFVCLFVFTGNITQIDAISETLGSFMEWDPVLTTVVASQFISNVPSTIMLSSFTDDWAGLLIGVNIGGFGTPIASMASVISLKLYQKTDDANLRRYMAVFLGMNFLMVGVLMAVHYLI